MIKIFPEYSPMKSVLINTPNKESLSIINNKNYKSFLFREPIKNTNKYISSHEHLEQILKENNVNILNIKNLPLSQDILKILNKNPNLIFTRDSVLFLSSGAIILNMATAERKMEPLIIKKILDKLKIPILFEIPKNVKVEGGDLIFLDKDTLLIGYGSRTNLEGINYLYKKLVLDLKIVKKIVAIKISEDRLNLDGVLMPIDKKIIVIDKSSIFDNAILFTKNKKEKMNIFDYFENINMNLIEITKKEGILLATNIFNLGNKKLIAYKHNKRVNQLLKKQGFKILELNGEMLIKGSGGPRCMTNPIRCG